MIKVLPPKTAKEVVAREKERKSRTTLLMALPEDHLAKFRQLKIHGAGVSHKDANKKFLRSLPSSWSQVALIMRTKPGLDTLSVDDLYNNLRVFECDVKGTTASSSNTQNIDDDDMKEIDLKWHVAMISMRIKKFHKRTGRKLQFDTKDQVGFDKTKVECFNCHKIRHFARDCRAKGNQDSRRRDVGYNGNKTRDNEALKEKEDLKTKSKNWQNSSKNLSRLLNTQMTAHDKFRLGYGDYRYGSILSDENGVLQSMFMNKTNDLEDTSVSDRYADGMHAVPPLITWNCMPYVLDVEIDYSKFTYGPKQTSANESDSKPCEYASCESDFSVETSTSMTEPVENASNVVCEPKV
nr:ribonuclease H-like domain-containing protein [Tanacetum cinerariifolium]